MFLKASNRIRTDDPFITSEVLYQLSYRSIMQIILYNLHLIKFFLIVVEIKVEFLLYIIILYLKDLLPTDYESVSLLTKPRKLFYYIKLLSFLQLILIICKRKYRLCSYFTSCFLFFFAHYSTNQHQL